MITNPKGTDFKILYKYTNKGAVQTWQIFQRDNTFYTVEGQLDGKLTTSLPTVCSPKNIGKKNETTPNQQAYLEAQAKWQKKVDSGYNEVLSTEKKFIEPLLAYEYEKYPIDWDKEEVYGQPKLDGLRGINENNTIMSRNGKPYVSTPHLYQDKVVLDGELYNHTLKEDFNKIVSLCKKQKPTPLELAESKEKVQFWVYDMPYVEGGYKERYEEMLKWHHSLSDVEKEFFKIVPSTVITSKEQLHEYHAKQIGLGYEGSMIRRINTPYEFKRSKQLLKFKDFIDEEFKILGYEEGTGGRAGTIGFFIMQHDVNPNQTFKSNVKGNFDYLKEVWANRDSYIGKTATVKYFQRTPQKDGENGNVPRFPYIIKINREEYE